MTMTIVPAPETSQYEYQLAHWNDDVRPQSIAGCAIMVAASTIAVTLRMASQKFYGGVCRLPDWLIVAAWVIAVPIAAEAIISYTHGFGLHQLRVVLSDKAPPHDLVLAFENGSFVSYAWVPCLACIKLSLLIYYNQLFQVSQRWLKVLSWIMTAYIIAWALASTPVLLSQCSPVPYFWERMALMYGIKPPRLHGHCLPQLAHLATPSITNTFSDVIVLLVPIAVLSKLQVPLGRKIGLVILFSLGIFVIAAGVIRICYVFKVSNEQDVTCMKSPRSRLNTTTEYLLTYKLGNDIGTVLWTVVETNVGIVCASIAPIMPLLRAGIRRLRREQSVVKESTFRWRWTRPSIVSRRRAAMIDSLDEMLREVGSEGRGPASNSDGYIMDLESQQPKEHCRKCGEAARLGCTVSPTRPLSPCVK